MSEPACCNCASECINAGGTSAHWCIYHTPDYEVIKQRCQQLEQMVKRQWNFIAARADKVPQATYILGKTAEAHEALGVGLDD